MPCSPSRSRSAPRHARARAATRPAAGRSRPRTLSPAGREAGHAHARHRRHALGGGVRGRGVAPVRRLDSDPHAVRRECDHRLRADARSATSAPGARRPGERRRPRLGPDGRDELPGARRAVPRRQPRARAARAGEPGRPAGARRRRPLGLVGLARPAGAAAEAVRPLAAAARPGRLPRRDGRHALRPGRGFDPVGRSARRRRATGSARWHGSTAPSSTPATIREQRLRRAWLGVHRERRPLGAARDDRHLDGRVRAARAGPAGRAAARRAGGGRPVRARLAREQRRRSPSFAGAAR